MYCPKCKQEFDDFKTICPECFGELKRSASGKNDGSDPLASTLDLGTSMDLSMDMSHLSLDSDGLTSNTSSEPIFSSASLPSLEIPSQSTILPPASSLIKPANTPLKSEPSKSEPIGDSPLSESFIEKACVPYRPFADKIPSAVSTAVSSAVPPALVAAATNVLDDASQTLEHVKEVKDTASQLYGTAKEIQSSSKSAVSAAKLFLKAKHSKPLSFEEKYQAVMRAVAATLEYKQGGGQFKALALENAKAALTALEQTPELKKPLSELVSQGKKAIKLTRNSLSSAQEAADDFNAAAEDAKLAKDLAVHALEATKQGMCLDADQYSQAFQEVINTFPGNKADLIKRKFSKPQLVTMERVAAAVVAAAAATTAAVAKKKSGQALDLPDILEAADELSKSSLNKKDAAKVRDILSSANDFLSLQGEGVELARQKTEQAHDSDVQATNIKAQQGTLEKERQKPQNRLAQEDYRPEYTRNDFQKTYQSPVDKVLERPTNPKYSQSQTRQKDSQQNKKPYVYSGANLETEQFENFAEGRFSSNTAAEESGELKQIDLTRDELFYNKSDKYVESFYQERSELPVKENLTEKKIDDLGDTTSYFHLMIALFTEMILPGLGFMVMGSFFSAIVASIFWFVVCQLITIDYFWIVPRVVDILIIKKFYGKNGK